MSVKVQGLVWDYYPEGGGELLVALKVADHADHSGANIWPGITTLAELTRQSERSVQRHLKTMVSRGWLVVVKKGGSGPGATTTYRIPVERIPLLVEARVSKRHPSERVTPSADKGDNRDKKGDTAVSPEPSLEAINNVTVAGGASPTPVSRGFKAYAEGIKRLYGTDYPPSRRANGMIANIVGRVGAANIEAVIGAYFASAEPWYRTTRHKLEFMVRDCELLLMAAQRQAGGAPAPTTMRVRLVRADEEVSRDLGEFPVADPASTAKEIATRKYARMIDAMRANKIDLRYVDVLIGGARNRYSIEELRR